MQSLKKFKNSVRLDGKNYYCSAYLATMKKSYNSLDFVKIGSRVYYYKNYRFKHLSLLVYI